MGLVDCDKHGHQGLVWGISNEVQQNILADVSMTTGDIAYIQIPGEEFSYFQPGYVLNKKLYNSLELEKIPVNTKENIDIIEAVLKNHITGICIKCYTEYIERHNLPQVLIDVLGIRKL